MCSPLTLYFYLLSSNSIYKQCDNNPSTARKSTYFCTGLKKPINNSEIISLNPLNATLLDLSHAHTDWITYLYKNGDCKNGPITAVVWRTSLW